MLAFAVPDDGARFADDGDGDGDGEDVADDGDGEDVGDDGDAETFAADGLAEDLAAAGARPAEDELVADVDRADFRAAGRAVEGCAAGRAVEGRAAAEFEARFAAELEAVASGKAALTEEVAMGAAGRAPADPAKPVTAAAEQLSSAANNVSRRMILPGAAMRLRQGLRQQGLRRKEGAATHCLRRNVAAPAQDQ